MANLWLRKLMLRVRDHCENGGALDARVVRLELLSRGLPGSVKLPDSVYVSPRLRLSHYGFL